MVFALVILSAWDSCCLTVWPASSCLKISFLNQYHIQDQDHQGTEHAEKLPPSAVLIGQSGWSSYSSPQNSPVTFNFTQVKVKSLRICKIMHHSSPTPYLSILICSHFPAWPLLLNRTGLLAVSQRYGLGSNLVPTVHFVWNTLPPVNCTAIHSLIEIFAQIYLLKEAFPDYPFWN